MLFDMMRTIKLINDDDDKYDDGELRRYFPMSLLSFLSLHRS